MVCVRLEQIKNCKTFFNCNKCSKYHLFIDMHIDGFTIVLQNTLKGAAESDAILANFQNVRTLLIRFKTQRYAYRQIRHDEVYRFIFKNLAFELKGWKKVIKSYHKLSSDFVQQLIFIFIRLFLGKTLDFAKLYNH